MADRDAALGEAHQLAEGVAPLAQGQARCVRRAGRRQHVENPPDMRINRHAWLDVVREAKSAHRQGVADRGRPLLHIQAVLPEERDGETWWHASFPAVNPATSYRWLLVGGAARYAWLNGLGASSHDVPDADDPF